MPKRHSIAVCEIADCDSTVYSGALCSLHYQRWYRHGDPLYSPPSAEERFWSKVDQTTGPVPASLGTRCWIWTASKVEDGYGRFWSGKNLAAHRVAYEWLVGPIPADREIDHRCHNRACVRPEHLRVVTRKQQMEHRQGVQQNNAGSGVRGVYRSGNRWVATIKHNRKAINLGSFATIAEAAAARRAAEKLYYTHVDPTA